MDDAVKFGPVPMIEFNRLVGPQFTKRETMLRLDLDEAEALADAIKNLVKAVRSK